MVLEPLKSESIIPPLFQEVMVDAPEKYVLVGWPEIQAYMTHPRWNECYLLSCREDQEYLDSTYAVPESLFEEMYV